MPDIISVKPAIESMTAKYDFTFSISIKFYMGPVANGVLFNLSGCNVLFTITDSNGKKVKEYSSGNGITLGSGEATLLISRVDLVPRTYKYSVSIIYPDNKKLPYVEGPFIIE
jgi:hypothetical protein